ncbi:MULTISPECIES: hypothetical protein [Pseudoalteromonas]|uniref:DUF3102 domain-containing protein n=1 Tax=Pseudoalteromonas amylolytica TaxID=1859457 RepID=A0A1S1MXW0_9GAMM|nr:MULTISPECIES: hypothetical protein [Pseudoalteromonas]OHU85506.1 hypothetical protein BFC16_19350 [Pseudoalteromonas sp. JW3]OHU91740.1 hypothetical protein BET10_08045 [Pseudoalteromonas amylolytica]
MSKELVAMVGDESADEIMHQFSQLGSSLHVELPESVEDCMNKVVALANRQFCDAAKMGMHLLWLKSVTKHGEYTTLLNEKGIHERLARRSIAIAKMLLSLPKSKTDKLSVLNMNQHQLSELTKVPIETLKELDDEDYEVLAETSGTAIKKQVAELIDKKTELEDTLAQTINELENERLRKAPTTRFDLPIFISEIRKDAVVHTELLNEALQQAQAGVRQLCELRSLDLTDRISAAQVVHHAYASIYTQIGTMLSQIHMEFGNHVQGIDNLPQFDDAEWQYVDTERERLLESFKLDLNKGDK